MMWTRVDHADGVVPESRNCHTLCALSAPGGAHALSSTRVIMFGGCGPVRPVNDVNCIMELDIATLTWSHAQSLSLAGATAAGILAPLPRSSPASTPTAAAVAAGASKFPSVALCEPELSDTLLPANR